MFRRRPAKRGPPGFARSREDITALGDSFGEMLTSPVRDAPPIARDAPLLNPLLKPEPPRRRKAQTGRKIQASQGQRRGRGAAADATAGLSGCA